MARRTPSKTDSETEATALRRRIAELERREAELAARVEGLLAQVDECTRLEEATRQSEHRFRNLVEGSIQGIMIQRGGKPLFVNESFARIFGYECAEDVLALESLEVLVPAAEWGQMRAYGAARLKGETPPSRYLSGGVKRDGSLLHLDTLVRTVEWDGEPAIQSTVVDVTERMHAQEAIKESEERLRGLFEHSPTLIILKDLAGRYQYVNGRHLEWHGVPPEAMIGKTAHEALPKEFADRVTAQDREVLQTGRLVQMELESKRPDGSDLIHLSAKFPMRDGKGNIVGLGVIATDITERKRAEEAVRESEARFKNVFDHSPSLILVKDLEGRYQYVNARHQDLYGVPASEIIGKCAHDFYAPEAADEFLRRDQEVARTGKSVSWEMEIARPNGMRATVINTKFPVRNGQGKVVGLCTIVTDITETRHLELQLRESQKLEAVGQLAGGIAHDFNNLLQIINGYALMALEKPGDEAQRRKYVKRVIEAGERAATLTRQLLTYSRKTVMREAPIDLNALISNLIEMVGRIIGEDVELTFTPQEHLYPVLADPGMLEQAVINLCVNARDAMPDGGRLDLTTERLDADTSLTARHGLPQAGRYAVLRVRDLGMGMTAAVRSRIFEPFFTTKEVGKGTGLGLSMVHSIVMQHGGSIAVESEPGQGTTFTICLPAAEIQPASEDPPGTGVVGAGRETILVAEDEAGVRNLLRDLLTSQGYRVLTAADGQEAVERFRAEPDGVDLVLLDVVMPKLKGPEVHSLIHRTRPDLPVLFSTGYSDEVLSAEYLKQHGLEVIQKPYRPTTLLQKLREILDRRP